jgi:hypothetical protein
MKGKGSTAPSISASPRTVHSAESLDPFHGYHFGVYTLTLAFTDILAQIRFDANP